MGIISQLCESFIGYFISSKFVHTIFIQLWYRHVYFLSVYGNDQWSLLLNQLTGTFKSVTFVCIFEFGTDGFLCWVWNSRHGLCTTILCVWTRRTNSGAEDFIELPVTLRSIRSERKLEQNLCQCLTAIELYCLVFFSFFDPNISRTMDLLIFCMKRNGKLCRWKCKRPLNF